MVKPSFLAKYKFVHLLFWLVVFGIWYFLRYEDYSAHSMAAQVTLIKTLDLALMIYLTNGLLIPRLLYKKRYAWFVLAFAMLVIASSVFKMQLLGRMMHNPMLYSLAGNLKGRIYDNVLPHFLLVMAGAAVKLMMDHAKLQQRMVSIAKEKAEAELNFLKSQINPHFLFNSINAVYFLIDKSNGEARNALGKFSDMLRYQLYEMKDDKVPIEKEIRYLEDYVDLQKLRRDHHYAVNFNYSPEVKDFFIEPLLLIPFVENAFKHISHFKEKQNFIRIQLSRTRQSFYCMIENSSEETSKPDDPHSGIGLANVQRRLELLYPAKHRLEIKKEEGLFKVELQIDI